MEDFYVPGLPGYSLMHAYTLFLPSLCYASKYLKSKEKLLYLFLLIVLCFVVIDTYVTTSLVIMIMVLVLSMVYSERHRNILGIVLALLFVIAFFCYEFGVFSFLVDLLLPFFRGTAVESKLVDLQSTSVDQICNCESNYTFVH